MKVPNKLAAALLAFGLPCALSLPGAAGASMQEARTESLKVTVEYKGAGNVDKDHKIWVWIFDTPTIDGSSIPIGVDSISENKGTASFSSLPETVYIAVCFDEKGGYDGAAGPPPSGSPVMVYGEVGAAKAVKTGADAKVTVTFDDSVRMP